MKRIILSALACSMISAAPSYAEMPEHMKDHMQGGAGATATEKETDALTKEGLTKEAEAGGVTVKVAYKNPGAKKAPVFDVTLDTHSVDLDKYSLEESAFLRDDSGGVYRASVVASSGSGHHREATAVFKDADISNAKFVEVVVKRLAGVKGRVFRFELVGNGATRE